MPTSIAPRFSSDRFNRNDPITKNTFTEWLTQHGATDITYTTGLTLEGDAYDIGFSINGITHRFEVERKEGWLQTADNPLSFAVTAKNGKLIVAEDIQWPKRKWLKLQDENTVEIYRTAFPSYRGKYIPPHLKPTLFGMMNYHGDRIITITPQVLLSGGDRERNCFGMGKQSFVFVPCEQAKFWVKNNDKWEKDTINNAGHSDKKDWWQG